MSKSLLQSISVVAIITMVSRICGCMRDICTAQIFGAGMAFDAFAVAFRIPNFMRRLFAEGAFAPAFVPVLTQQQQQGSMQQQQEFINIVFGNLALILIIVTACGIVFAPAIVQIFAPGFSKAKPGFSLTVSMLRLTFPYLTLIALTAFANALLNTYNKYWVGALTPVLLNLTMIAAAWLLAPLLTPAILALAWGVLIAGFLQLAFALLIVARCGIKLRPKISWQHPGVKQILKLMVPSLFGVSVSQINLLLDTMFASLLTAGSVSWLYYADRLMEFPLGVFGVTIATVILPSLSRHANNCSTLNFALILDWAIRMVLLIAIPATVMISILALPLLASLFNYGHFGRNAVLMTSKSLVMFSLGVTPLMLIKILAAGFYARQNIATPVRIGIIAMLANMVLNCLLILPLAHAGIALATSIAALLNMSGLWYFLRQQQIYISKSNWGGFILKIAVANFIMGAYLYWHKAANAIWLAHNASWRLTHLAALILPAILIYFMSLCLTGLRCSDILSPTLN